MLITTSYLSAQDVRFSANIYAEPQHYTPELWDKADGFNIGAGIEYQMTVVYFDADVFFFPDLNGVSYFHAQGTVLGFNSHSKWREWRFKAGVIKPGLIRRSEFTYPMIGSDIGIEYYFDNGVYIGWELSGDWRTDDKYWSSTATGYYQISSGIKLGIYW